MTKRSKPESSAAGADQTLRAFAARLESATVDPQVAVAEALSSVADRAFCIVDEEGRATFVPPNLFQLRFSSPAVGLDEKRMRDFIQHLAVMFDSRTSARILHEVAPLPGQRIGQVSELIGLWQASPEM
jgi:hypothetical protein